MDERAREGHTQGVPPIVPASSRAKRVRVADGNTYPELHLVLGRDTYSSGVNLSALLPTGGEHPSPVTLFEMRWQKPLRDVREAVRIARRALDRYAELQGWDLND